MLTGEQGGGELSVLSGLRRGQPESRRRLTGQGHTQTEAETLSVGPDVCTELSLDTVGLVWEVQRRR